jgi:transposase
MEHVMSLRPLPWPEPAEEIVVAVRAMYRGREVPLPVAVRDQLGELFADEQFAKAFGARGKPGWSPGRLALVTVLQMAENLTDRQAAEAVRDKISWKYALGMTLDDPGFDASILSEFRARLVAHGLEERALDLLLTVLQDKGLVAAGSKQRTDSTHVVAAVRDLNRLEPAGESVRALLKALAVAAPGWPAEAITVPGWGKRYAARADSWRLPASQATRTDLVPAYGTDGYALLRAVYSPDAPGWLRELPAAGGAAGGAAAELHPHGHRQRAGGDHTAGGGHRPLSRRGRWRVSSPDDTDARWAVKRDTFSERLQGARQRDLRTPRH